MKLMKGMLVFAAVLGMTTAGWAEHDIAKESAKADHGIRISLGMAPGISEGEIMGMTFPIDDDTGGQLEVLYTRRHWTKSNPNFAGIWGAGVFFAGNSGSDNDPVDPWDYDLSAFGVLGQGGVAYKIGDILVLEAQPYFGLGGANVEITEFSDGGATYFLYGIKGGAFVALGKAVELGVEVGYQGFSSEVELDFGGPTADLTLTGDGLHASAVLAIKF
jgi:hypothetical protein